MRKFIVLVAILLVAATLYSEPINIFRFGFLAPMDASIGTMAGYCYGSSFDNTITLFTSGDIFYRNYVKEKKIGYATDDAHNPVSII